MKNRSFHLLSASLIITFTACKSKPLTEKLTEEIIPVRTMTLQQETVSQQLFTSGQFTTDDETNLSFKTSGIIHRIFVKEGEAVKQGQLLATLHLTEVNAIAEQAALAYQKAERDYERASNLYRDSVATLEQMQNAKTALAIAKQQYSSAGFNRNFSEIRAVKSGYVLRKYLNEGQYAGSGTAVLQVNGAGKSGNWILKAGVSDHQWSAIRIGDKATITTDAAPGREMNGTVSAKPEGIDPLSGTFIIHLKLSANTVPLAAGLFGKATIRPSLTTTAWAIPYDALLDGDANSGYVFITNDNATAKKIKVQLSNIENGKVIVTRGLENTKALIVTGSAYLNDGSKITVKNASPRLQ